jgi:hypothetical protein
MRPRTAAKLRRALPSRTSLYLAGRLCQNPSTRSKQIMRILKRSAGLLVIALALFAVAATAASAANPEFLDNVSGNTFTAKSPEGKLTAGGLTIICKKDTISLENGKVLTAKTIETTVDFEKCTIAGLAANSLSDAAETILVKATGELCYISKAEKHVGVLFTITPVHIEVPALSELLEVKGTVLGLLEKVNTLSSVTQPTVTINTATAKEHCEGSTAPVLLSEKAHNKEPVAATETTTEELTFDKDIEVMA